MGGQMTNQQAQVLVKQFLKTGSCDVFDELWSSTVMMVNPYKYFDPSGARDEEDFEQVTRIGLYQAIDTWEEGKGSSILTWIRMRMHQALIKEVRKMVRESRLGTKISLDQSIYLENDSKTSVEQLIYKSLNETEGYNRQFNEDLYWQIYADVEQKICRNRALAKVFYFKMAFPNATRETISKTFGLSKPCISTYFSTIKTCIDLAQKKYAV
tara:strand:- start:672 stop:1307 length:636 start_codon:yes stop_codon:yes gene_type:complete